MNGVFDQLTLSKEEKNQGDELLTQEKDIDETQGEINEAATPHGAVAQQYTLKQIKEVSQQLIKHGLIESAAKPGLYQAALTHNTKIKDILEPFNLDIKIDDIRGLIFVVVANHVTEEDDELWSHPLVRRQRLNMEQSLLIAILRQRFVTHELDAGVGDNSAVIHIDEILPELNAYLGDLGSETREDKRLRNLLEQLKAYGVVTDINEHEQITIRPLIAHIANPENLTNLLIAIKRKANKIPEETSS